MAVVAVVFLAACTPDGGALESTDGLARTVGEPTVGQSRVVVTPTSEADPSSATSSQPSSGVAAGTDESLPGEGVEESVADATPGDAIGPVDDGGQDAPSATPTAGPAGAAEVSAPEVTDPVVEAAAIPSNENEDAPPGADVTGTTTTSVVPAADAPPGAEALPAAVPPAVPPTPDADDAPPGALDDLEVPPPPEPPEETDAPPGALDLVGG